MSPYTNFSITSLKHSLLPILTIACCTLTSNQTATAQIVPDTTLGAENSVVTRDNVNGIPTDIITVGATREGNLFHSFSQFSVLEGTGAYFAPSGSVENILTRVTGGNPSNIFGTLGVLNSNANLFLINPNGIFFGPNARLDLKGSFVGSTADSLVFSNDFQFSAGNPQAVPLLTVDIPIGLRFRDNPGDIPVETGQNPPVGIRLTEASLSVEPRETLALIGGNIILDNSEIIASSSNVFLGGLTVAGTVTLNPDLSLALPENLTGRDVTINSSRVNVSGDGGGNIAIAAGNVTITGQSELLAGIAVGNGSPDARAGDIEIRATEAIALEDSMISNNVNSDARGNGGNIRIESGSLGLIDGSSIIASTSGQGNAGLVDITATDTISLSGENNRGAPSNIRSTVLRGAVGDSAGINLNTVSLIFTDDSSSATGVFGRGNAGEININTASLTLTDGSFLDASIFGMGDAGAINITATDTISISGRTRPGGANIQSVVGRGAVGNSGGININTGSLRLTDRASISTSTSGQGNAGSINISATDTISISGETSPGSVPPPGGGNLGANLSNIQSVVARGAVGNSGGINLNTGFLGLIDGASISASTSGQGNAGLVDITATDTISLSGENNLGARSNIRSTVVEGAVGDSAGINLNTVSLTFTDGSSSATGVFGRGNAGEININTDSLTLTDGSFLDASIFGIGDAGAINITATDTISISGRTRPGGANIQSAVGRGAVGNSGGININTGSLGLTDGASISASTSGQGNAGLVDITATDTISLSGENNLQNPSNIRSSVLERAVGNSGGIRINTSSLILTDGSSLATGVFGGGNAGEININTASLTLTDGSFIDASIFGIGDAAAINITATDTISLSGRNSRGDANIQSAVAPGAVGNSGGINLNTDSLYVIDGAVISSSTNGEGNAGLIDITATDIISFSGENVPGIDSGIESEVEAQAVGNSEGVKIRTGSLILTDDSEIAASTNGEGNAGNINITANSLEITNNSVIETDSTTNFAAGDINLEIQENLLLSNSEILAETSGNQDAGDITIYSPQLTLTELGRINANTSGSGNAGNILIQGRSLNLTENAIVTTNTEGEGRAGEITFQIEDSLNLASSAIEASTAPQSTGDGGNINIDPILVNLTDDSRIAVNSEGSGDGGSINLQADNLNLNNNSEISAATASGQGGNITLDVSNILTQGSNSSIITTAGGDGDGGDITINSRFIIGNENSDIRANAFQGSGGNIDITVEGIFRSFDSEIDASSDLGIDGVVETNTPDVDPAQGLIQLEANLVDTASLIAQDACQKGSESEFVVTGRGGLPPNQTEVLDGDLTRVGLVPLVGEARSSGSSGASSFPVASRNPGKIVPARGWIFNELGEVKLVGYNPSQKQPVRKQDSVRCQPR